MLVLQALSKSMSDYILNKGSLVFFNNVVDVDLYTIYINISFATYS